MPDAYNAGQIALTSPPATTNAGSDTPLTFASRVHRLIIQNNTSAPVYVDFDVAATLGAFVIAANGQGDFINLPCLVLHLYTAAAQNINGTAVGGIVVKGWV